jgi:predicted lipoprotein with Yx(FWY)xxD motif
MRKSLYTAAVAVSAAFALSACGAVDLRPTRGPAADAAPAAQPPAAPNDESGAEDGTEDGTEPSAEPSASSSAPAAPGIKAVQIPLGTIVTNVAGLPLYRFDQDGTNPSRSTCYDACAQKFAAYPWSADLTLEGVDKKYIGKVQRKDGTWQLTINKSPMYLYSADSAGEWKGHGVSGTWWLVTPAGKKVPAAKQTTGTDY